MTTSLKLIAAGAALVLAASAAQAELIQNGGFELGSAGWTLSGNTLFSVFDDFAPHSGLMAAGFGAPPADPAFLSQTLATQAGSSYQVSYWLQNTVGASDGQPNFFSLNWDGGAAEVLLADAGAFGYSFYSHTFVATSSSTELSFSFGNFASYWDFDDVSAVSAVPEPQPAALLALGLLAGFLVRQRRSR